MIKKLKVLSLKTKEDYFFYFDTFLVTSLVLHLLLNTVLRAESETGLYFLFICIGSIISF